MEIVYTCILYIKYTMEPSEIVFILYLKFHGTHGNDIYLIIKVPWSLKK